MESQPPKVIAGVDEAGRGALAGPVVAAAVIMPDDSGLQLKDSKKLTAQQRDHLYADITKRARDWAVAAIEPKVIDQINILQATQRAMEQAIHKLRYKLDFVRADGQVKLQLPCSYESVIDGDDTVSVISAASILAKVSRDRMMAEYDEQYPEYGFANNKGYGTAKHRQALESQGVSPIHRLSYAPCRQAARMTVSE